MIEIIPAVLPKSFDELREQLEHIRGIAPTVQIDLVGENVLEGKEEIPLWQEFDFECDVMLAHPARTALQLAELGASSIVVHANNAEARTALELLQDKRLARGRSTAEGGGEEPLVVGVALQAHDAPEALLPFAGLYDFVQVMGIEHEGAQGEPPDPHHAELLLLRALRAQYPELLLQVDGAVAPHVRELSAAGASRLVVGSAIVRAENPHAVYKQLYTEANAT